MHRWSMELALLQQLYTGLKGYEPAVVVRPISASRRLANQQMLEEIELMAWSLSQPTRL